MYKDNTVYAINELEGYWGQCIPLGDWKNINSDMPLMTTFVHNFYNAKASQNNKLAFYNGILESFADPNKEAQITKNRFAGIGPQAVGVIKELVNDTINIRNKSSVAFVNEELRKEFVTSINQVAGAQQNGAIAERDIAGLISNPAALVQILSNTTVIDMLKGANENLVKELIPNILPIASTLKQLNPAFYETFRKMLSVVETFGILSTILTNVHTAAKAIQPASVVSNTPGVGIGLIPAQTAPTNTVQNAIADINNIANTMAPFGNDVPNRIKYILERATPEDIYDIKNIIANTQLPLKNISKYALAVSAAYATTASNQIFGQAPRNIGIAMLYISKVWADIMTKTDAQTGDIGEGFKHITGLPMTITNGYRLSMAQAISYDMSVINYTATDCLAKLTNIPELSNFARHCLSKTSAGVAQLSKGALMEFMKSRGSVNATISLNDIDAYLQTIHYPSNGNDRFRQDLLTAILDAINMI